MPSSHQVPPWGRCATPCLKRVTVRPRGGVLMALRRRASPSGSENLRQVSSPWLNARSTAGCLHCGRAWHFICTIRRDHLPGGPGPIHADTFDGCMVAFALAANKIQTPIYPAAHFSPPAVVQFVSAATGSDPTCRPDEIRLALAADGSECCGPPRGTRGAPVVVILPGAVAHAIPDRSRLHDEETTDSRGEPLAQAADNRWFCRVSIELIAGGVTQDGARDGGAWEQWRRPWPNPLLRRQVARLTAAHVWGDPDFAERAYRLMESDATRAVGEAT